MFDEQKEVLSWETRIKWLFFSWAFLKFDSLSLGLWERVWFVLNQSACFGAKIACVHIGPGWASQIKEILKSKSSHLILVTLDNTSFIIRWFQLHLFEKRQMLFANTFLKGAVWSNKIRWLLKLRYERSISHKYGLSFCLTTKTWAILFFKWFSTNLILSKSVNSLDQNINFKNPHPRVVLWLFHWKPRPFTFFVLFT